MLSDLIALVAVVLIFVTLIRERKYKNISEKYLALSTKFERANAKLAEKQLSKIIDEEALEGQPRFAIQTMNIGGYGEFGSENYYVEITISIENTCNEYLKAKNVSLVSLEDGMFKSGVVKGAYIRHIDIRERDPIIGKHVIVINPDSNLIACELHISYLDNTGAEKFQSFSVFPEGPPGPVPHQVYFKLETIYNKGPSLLWEI